MMNERHSSSIRARILSCIVGCVLVTTVSSTPNLNGQTLAQRQQLATDLNNLQSETLDLDPQAHGTAVIRALGGECATPYEAKLFLKEAEIGGVNGYLIGRALSGPDSIEVSEAAHTIICDLRSLIEHALNGSQVRNDGGDASKNFAVGCPSADCSTPGSFQRFFMVEVSDPPGTNEPQVNVGSTPWTPLSNVYVGQYRNAGVEIENPYWKAGHFFYGGRDPVRSGSYTGRSRTYYLAKRCDTVTNDNPDPTPDQVVYNAVKYRHAASTLIFDYRWSDDGQNFDEDSDDISTYASYQGKTYVLPWAENSDLNRLDSIRMGAFHSAVCGWGENSEIRIFPTTNRRSACSAEKSSRKR